MLSMELTGNWSQAKRGLIGMPSRIKRAQQLALREEAKFFHGKIIEGLVSQAPGGTPLKPLSPWTLATRGLLQQKSTSALIQRGDLMRAIKLHQIDAENVFVGIKDTAKNIEGVSLYAIAQMNEYGSGPRVIRLTPKMVRYLAMVARQMGVQRPGGGTIGAHSAGKFIVVTIPARPFLKPVFEKYGRAEDVERRMKERVESVLLGAFA